MIRRTLAAFAFWMGLVSPIFAQQSVFSPATTAQIAITGTASGTAVKIVSGLAGKSIYVTAVNIVPVSTSVVTFTAGTGTNCGTNGVNITGAMTFATGQNLDMGSGLGAIWVVPQGDDLCITIATAAAPGALAYAQF